MNASVASQLPAWISLVFQTPDPADAWRQIAAFIRDQSQQSANSGPLQMQLSPLDRVLAEAAWNLWEVFPEQAPRTVDALGQWWSSRAGAGLGRAVLILDALSLRELPILLRACAARGVIPLAIQATAAEVPTDTDHFARALGVSTRGSLSNNGASAGFLLQSAQGYTDVFASPFADCIADVPPRRDLVIWHSWLDDLIHLHRRGVAEIERATERELTGDDFWRFVDTLRKGRRLVITADHGYAVSTLFPIEEPEGLAKNFLVRTFGASRNVSATDPLPMGFMPPLALTKNGGHVVLGQRHWKVQGGFPHLCHGGLSLLEAFVPFIELPEVA